MKRVLEDAGPPVAKTALLNAFDWFAGYVILDALIGNTDRHQDNWAAIRRGASQRLAPSFDHASSLGFLLSDEERAVRLATNDRNRTVAAYGSRARTKFQGNPLPVDATVDALTMASAEARRRWCSTIRAGLDLAEILDLIPGERMSESAMQFARALFEENLKTLQHPLRTMEL